MLGLNVNNCPLFNATVTKEWPAFEQTADTKYKDFFTRLGGLFGVDNVDVKQAQSMCRYLLWADIQEVPLQFATNANDLTNCDSL